MGSGSYGDVFEVKLINQHYINNIDKKSMVVKKFKYEDIFKRHMHLEYFLEMIELLRNNPND